MDRVARAGLSGAKEAPRFRTGNPGHPSIHCRQSPGNLWRVSLVTALRREAEEKSGKKIQGRNICGRRILLPQILSRPPCVSPGFWPEHSERQAKWVRACRNLLYSQIIHCVVSTSVLKLISHWSDRIPSEPRQLAEFVGREICSK